MSQIDPRLVKARRFPVHAAVDQCNFEEVKKLLDEDARFHCPRKIPDLMTSILHQACAARTSGTPELFIQVVKYVVQSGGPMNDADSVGQIPLHYAVCHFQAVEIVPILIEAGSNVDATRSGDQWTPLHLAAMFGKNEVAKILIDAGADSTMKDLDGNTAEDIARKYRHYDLADLLRSPRLQFRPAHAIPTGDSPHAILFALIEEDSIDALMLKIKDEHVNWRDAQDNTLLHLAAWNGVKWLVRTFLESVKGRKLVTAVNHQGATPLMLAIIAGQAATVEEFFMHKKGKTQINLSQALPCTKQTIVHLLIDYCPLVHPKFVLKRKDMTAEILNQKDANGNSPLLSCAQRNSSRTVGRILNNKHVKDDELLDLGLKNSQGKTILHLVVENKDEVNLGRLLDREELTEDIINMKDKDGRNAIEMCLEQGGSMAMAMFGHPSAHERMPLDSVVDGTSLLHRIAQLGDGNLWKVIMDRSDSDINLNVQDADGNTPMMKAICLKRIKVVEAWLGHNMYCVSKIDVDVRNKKGQTVFMLLADNVEHALILKFLRIVDLKTSINAQDCKGNTVMHLLTQAGKWDLVQDLLVTQRLKDRSGNGVIDVHIANQFSETLLISLLAARLKATKEEASAQIRCKADEIKMARAEQETIWELVKLVLEREREIHGTSMVKGRDVGIQCLRKQMELCKFIKSPLPEEVEKAFTRLYNLIVSTPKKRRSSIDEEAVNGHDLLEEPIPAPRVRRKSSGRRSTSAERQPKPTCKSPSPPHDALLRDEAPKEVDLKEVAPKEVAPKTPELKITPDLIAMVPTEKKSEVLAAQSLLMRIESELNSLSDIKLDDPKPTAEQPKVEQPKPSKAERSWDFLSDMNSWSDSNGSEESKDDGANWLEQYMNTKNDSGKMLIQNSDIKEEKKLPYNPFGVPKARNLTQKVAKKTESPKPKPTKVEPAPHNEVAKPGQSKMENEAKSKISSPKSSTENGPTTVNEQSSPVPVKTVEAKRLTIEVTDSRERSSDLKLPLSVPTQQTNPVPVIPVRSPVRKEKRSMSTETEPPLMVDAWTQTDPIPRKSVGMEVCTCTCIKHRAWRDEPASKFKSLYF